MDDFKNMVVELRRATISAVLDGLRNEPSPGWCQVARGLLNDNSDLLAVSDEEVSQDTLDILQKINDELKLAE